MNGIDNYRPEHDLAPMDVALKNRPAPPRVVVVDRPDETPPVAISQREQLPPDDDVFIPGGIPVQPLIDRPLRDPSICRAPTGGFYLTGTVATPKPEVGGRQSDHTTPRNKFGDQAPDTRLPRALRGHPTFDFQNNDGIFLWRSNDLVHWETIGCVWDLTTHPDRDPKSAWQKKKRMHPDDPDGLPVRGISAPEIHFLRNSFWIAFSMNGQGTGLLRSETGRPEGPYVDHARITTRGGDASMFADDDGSVYWVWGEGWIAKMKDDLTALAEKPRLLQPSPHSDLGESPLTVGRRGAFLFKADGRYYLTAADRFGRLFETPCHDTFVAVADRVYGPYSRRFVMIPHGGPTTVFSDETGRLYGTMSGDDRFSLCRDRACLVPLVIDRTTTESDKGAWAVQAGITNGSPHPPLIRKRRWAITERGAQARVKPVRLPGVEWIRDPNVQLGGDGALYLTGTTTKVGLRAPGIRIWRSEDLEQWEPLGDEHGVVWYAEDWDWCSRPRAANYLKQPVVSHRLWGGGLYYLKGQYWLTFTMSYGGAGILRSVSGKPEGPYEPAYHFDVIGLGGTLFEDHAEDGGTGRVYLCCNCTQIAPMKDDMQGIESEPRNILTARGTRYGYEGGRIERIMGKYVLYGVDWNGVDIWLDGRKGEGTYDLVYCLSDELYGPYGEPRLAIPHVGHPFRDRDGRWWASTFGNGNGDVTAALPCELSFIPLRVERDGDDLIIEPADR